MKRNNSPRKLLILFAFLFCISVLIVIGPLFVQGFPVTDDGDWMIIRLSAFYQTLKEGQIPVRFLGRLNFGYGYPVANFLYPGFLYIGSILKIIGFSFVDSVKILLSISIVGSCFFLFFTLKHFFSTTSSLGAVTVFLLSPYIFFDLYKRGSVGEILALFAGIFVLWSITYKKSAGMVIGMFLLIISHNTLAVFFTILILVYIMALRTYNYYIPMVFGIFSAAFFWIPASFERGLVKFSDTLIARPFDYFTIPYTFGLIPAVSFIAFLLIFIRKKPHSPIIRIMLSFFAVTVFLMTPLGLPFWSLKSLVLFVQFPFRFLSITIVSGSFLTANILESVGNVRNKVILYGIFILMSVFQLVPLANNLKYEVKPEGFYSTNEATTTVSDEYMPKWVKLPIRSRPLSTISVISGNAEVLSNEFAISKIHATIKAETESKMQINMIYYPGWGITIDGMPVKLDYKNDFGLMQFSLPVGIHNVRAEFHETIGRFIADIISLLSIVGFILYETYNRSRITAVRQK